MKSKYPPFPQSNSDYAIRHSARTQLRKPNKAICIYCRQQALTENTLRHSQDCPAKRESHESP